MWTSENRSKYDRSKLRYPSDLTDEDWSIIGPLISDAKGGVNKRTIDVRAVLNGVMYILSTPAVSGQRFRRTCRRGVR